LTEKLGGSLSEASHSMQMNGFVEGALECIHGDGFGKIVECSIFESLYGSVHGWLTGHENDRNVEIVRPDFSKERDAVHARHCYVRQDGIEIDLRDEPNGFLPVRRCRGQVTARAQDSTQRTHYGRIVVD